MPRRNPENRMSKTQTRIVTASVTASAVLVVGYLLWGWYTLTCGDCGAGHALDRAARAIDAQERAKLH